MNVHSNNNPHARFNIILIYIPTQFAKTSNSRAVPFHFVELFAQPPGSNQSTVTNQHNRKL